MLNKNTLCGAIAAISATMTENRQYLIELDQRNGDGDLGISMSDGFAAACSALNESAENDLGRLLISASKAFNEAAPSSLGTIMSLYMMGMARLLKGHTEANLALLGIAMQEGVAKIMEKAGSKPGEKTILDALAPASETLLQNQNAGSSAALKAAAKAARDGSDETIHMPAVHGRAAYYGDRAIGLVDGGSVVGALLFEALASFAKDSE